MATADSLPRSNQSDFEQGILELRQGNPKQAAEAFHAALRRLTHTGAERARMRCLSFYGLSLALAGEPTAEALRACEVAARRNFFDPDVFLNLGKVYLIVGRTTQALSALERGLKLDPSHRGLRAELERADRRSRPWFPWLGRGHALNQWLGRVRRSLHQFEDDDPKARADAAKALASGVRSASDHDGPDRRRPDSDSGQVQEASDNGNRRSDGSRSLCASPLRRSRDRSAPR